jgi:hypothetical protein
MPMTRPWSDHGREDDRHVTLENVRVPLTPQPSNSYQQCGGELALSIHHHLASEIFLNTSTLNKEPRIYYNTFSSLKHGI